MLRLTREECEATLRTLDWVLHATQGDEKQKKITLTVMDKLKIALKVSSEDIEIFLDDNS